MHICLRLALAYFLFLSYGLNAAELFVSSSGSSTPPYNSWNTSATNIQDALSQAAKGDTVWVSNGVYSGAAGWREGATNVIVLTNNVALRSVNGPDVTIIEGGNGIRCVYAAGSNTVLDGFTLRSGSVTNYNEGNPDGGGAYCRDYALITNCLAVSNSAFSGGGIYLVGAYAKDCVCVANVAFYDGGGAAAWENAETFGGRLNRCTLKQNVAARGGGIFGRRVEVSNCKIFENQTYAGSYDGGGAYLQYELSQIRQCLIYSNYAGRHGGGVYLLSGAQMDQCTIVANEGGTSGGICAQGGGTINNSITYGNDGSNLRSNVYWFSLPAPVYTFSCLAPLTNATDCITDDPLVHLPSGQLMGDSPCVNMGANSAWMQTATDMDGDPRIFGGRVDIGCDETFIGNASLSCTPSVQLSWRVPRGARIQYQITTSLTNEWSNLGAPVIAAGETVYHGHASFYTNCFYRAVWQRP